MSKATMENSQSVQQQSSQSKAPIPEPGNKVSPTTVSKNPLINLLVHHTWLLPAGLLLISLGSTAAALYSLGHVGRMQPEEPEIAEAEIIKPIKAPSKAINPTPLWMVVTIALSCGSGTLIIFLLLNRPAQPQEATNNINRYQKRLAKRRPASKPRPKKNVPAFVPSKPRTPVVAMPTRTEPVVTVLPPEQNVSPSQGKESLANMLDMRKHTPLSSIIRKN